VQGDLEQVLTAIEGAPVHVAGAGRTDAGVHAAAQVASVRLTAGITPERLVRACNASLRDDVRVLAADEAVGEFHARLHARGKSYRYVIWHAATASPRLRRLAWHIPQRLSLAAMQDAAAAFMGEHDFGAFQARGSRLRTTVRRVWTSSIEPHQQLPPWIATPNERSRLLVYEVSGNGFLRHQVRAMVGTLVQVGRGRMTRADIVRALRGATRAAAGPTAPAHGLHLWRVDYGDDGPDLPNVL
jgi:tRNA pseudouridine38-40 synthase